MKMIDVNAAFGFWPIQRFSNETLEGLDNAFAKVDVEEVWLSAIEGILYPEPDSWDKKLFERLSAFPRFRSVKTVNPVLANWQKSWDALSGFSLAAVKLFPNYHGYSLDAPYVADICEKAAAEKLPVLIQMRVNDERNQPHFLQVGGVPAQDVVALSTRHPNTQIIALCPYNQEFSILAKGGANLLMDIAFLDGAAILERMVKNVPQERIVFGSGEAFVHVYSAVLKLRHSRLPAETIRQIASENLRAH